MDKFSNELHFLIEGFFAFVFPLHSLSSLLIPRRGKLVDVFSSSLPSLFLRGEPSSICSSILFAEPSSFERANLDRCCKYDFSVLWDTFPLPLLLSFSAQLSSEDRSKRMFRIAFRNTASTSVVISSSERFLVPRSFSHLCRNLFRWWSQNFFHLFSWLSSFPSLEDFNVFAESVDDCLSRISVTLSRLEKQPLPLLDEAAAVESASTAACDFDFWKFDVSSFEPFIEHTFWSIPITVRSHFFSESIIVPVFRIRNRKEENRWTNAKGTNAFAFLRLAVEKYFLRNVSFHLRDQ